MCGSDVLTVYAMCAPVLLMCRNSSKTAHLVWIPTLPDPSYLQLVSNIHHRT